MSRRRRHKIVLSSMVLAALIIALPIVAYAITQSSAWDVALRESGYVTYAVDCGLGDAAVGGAHDAFKAWDEANDGITLAESESWSEADVRVARMDALATISERIDGCACIGVSPVCPILNNVVHWSVGCVIPNGGTIGVVDDGSDVDEERYPYARALMRDLVAHEFGHNLGIVHNTANRSHMMYGPHAVPPHTDRGYVIPERIAGDDTVLAALAAKRGMPESCSEP